MLATLSVFIFFFILVACTPGQGDLCIRCYNGGCLRSGLCRRGFLLVPAEGTARPRGAGIMLSISMTTHAEVGPDGGGCSAGTDACTEDSALGPCSAGSCSC